ncbi:CRTAC1 family protein [Tundrisphaera sp. TA3]|uniref:CRTAC1 family protein n=1 Tax=Tundrisphaera sp. TA3 TaxID=3435775 RepID=UPI003EC12FAB
MHPGTLTACRVGVLLLLVVGPARGDDGPLVLRDRAAGSGVDFRFHAGSRGRHDLPEIMGGGLGLIDADGDGRLDVYACNGGPISGDGPDPPSRLFRNAGGGRFEEITAAADAPGPSYAMGVAVGDFDGDGRDDLFVSGWRDQRLYRNAGGGRFQDVTGRAGLSSRDWGTSAAFADLDGDGDLDLYVATYLDYDPGAAPFCAAPDGRRDYCGPEEFAAQPDHLYRNDGDGRFTDVARESGIALPGGRGLGVVIADLTGDRRPDIYVANDGSACWLFENLGGLRFREVGVAAGVAFDARGDALAGMGVAVGDLDGDCRPDLAATNFLRRSTVAFRALGHGQFAEDSGPLGIAAPTRPVLGFGLALADLDADGDLDLFQANGHVLDRARLGDPFAMRPTLLRNRAGRFSDASDRAGPWFARPILGRGVASGDLDGDGGPPDLLVAALDAPLALLRVDAPAGRSLVLDLAARPPAHRSAVGARVRATVGSRTLVRDVVAGGGYLSASDPRIHLGLGAAEAVDRLEVAWPSGRIETWARLPAGPPIRLDEGTAPR